MNDLSHTNSDLVESTNTGESSQLQNNPDSLSGQGTTTFKRRRPSFRRLVRHPRGISFGHNVGEAEAGDFPKDIDCFIHSSNFGYSPLGHFSEKMGEICGYCRDEIQGISYWNEGDNPEPALIAYSNINPDSGFKGFVTGASPNCSALGQPLQEDRWPPEDHFDAGYLYDVAYTSIEYAVQQMRATRIALTHWLQGAQDYRREIICTYKALSDFCNLHPDSGLQYLFYTGCCIQPQHFKGIRYNEIDNEYAQLGGTEPRRLGGRNPEPDWTGGQPYEEDIPQGEGIVYVPFLRNIA